MATVFDSVGIRGLRPAHFNQLLAYLYEAERSRWYYGPEKHFRKRHKELKKWLENIYEYSTEEGVVIPKAL